MIEPKCLLFFVLLLGSYMSAKYKVSTVTKHHTTRTYRELEVKPHSF